MRIENGYTFFWKSKSPFSNWYTQAPFVSAEGYTFRTNEHYMMYKKAELFGDRESMVKILTVKNPSEAKSLGRQVTNFEKTLWDKNARQVVYHGCKAKFEQNLDARAALLANYPTVFVEASPSDPIWGVGLVEEDDLILNPKNWKGLNWLGEVLTALRNDIMYFDPSLWNADFTMREWS